MLVSLIVAHGSNNEIGKDNQLLWHISEDLKNFKKLTLNHILVMGRKTYESIGRPLPKRQTIILTRQSDYQADGCLIAHSVDEVFSLAKGCGDFNQEELFIAGGGEIYSVFLPKADRLYITEVECSLDADTYFPHVNRAEWKVMQEEYHPKKDDSFSWVFRIFHRH